MADLNSLIEKTKQYLAKAGKTLIENHKKKLIAAVLLLVGGYIIKKKMTMSHLITIVDCVSKLIQYLPLPDSPKLRQLTPYEHPQPVPLKAIIGPAEEMKGKFTRKEIGIECVKDSIFTSATLTLLLYNVNSFYFLVQTKYHQQFNQLQALEAFEQAMYLLRKRFTEQIPRIFSQLQMSLQPQLNKIEINNVYDLQQLEEIFDRLTNCALERRFNVKEQQKRSLIHKAGKQAKNYFTSVYQQQQEKKSPILIRVAGGLLSFLAGSLRVFDWFPQIKQEITCERYEFIRRSYYMSALKTQVQGVKWPNQISKELFQLILEETISMLLSLNFSVLLQEHSRYNKQVLLNRIRIWMQNNQSSNVKIIRFLSPFLKILNEEFFKNEIYNLRDQYHEKELKKSIRRLTMASNEQEAIQAAEQNERTLEQGILEEIRMKKAYQYLEREFQIKYFNERSGFVHRPKRQESEGSEAKEVQKMLNIFSGNEVLNNPQ